MREAMRPSAAQAAARSTLVGAGHGRGRLGLRTALCQTALGQATSVAAMTHIHEAFDSLP
jgi:hypothetical protein